MTQFVLTTLTNYNDSALIEEIKRVANIVDPTLKLTRKLFNKHSKVHPSTISKRFGTWEESLAKAGLSNRFDSSNKKISKDEMIKELKRISALLETNIVKHTDVIQHGQLSYNVILKEFGSWKKAMEAAGLGVSNLGRRYSEEECFENLLTVWTHYGRQPSYTEIKQLPSEVGPKAYILRWGNWRNALKAFVDKVNSDLSEEESPNEQNITPIEYRKVITKIPAFQRREIKIGLRFDVFKRDRYRCVMCGRSPSTSLDIELHVDHIIPFSKGGKTIAENLRTLCSHCNIGKSNKID